MCVVLEILQAYVRFKSHSEARKALEAHLRIPYCRWFGETAYSYVIGIYKDLLVSHSVSSQVVAL